MKLNKLTKEELETMSYNDIAYEIIKKQKKSNIADLLKQIMEILELPSKTFENKIGNFYTALINDKRFLMLDDGLWDLSENHKSKKHTDELEDLDDFDEDIYDDSPEETEEKEDSEKNDLKEEYKNLVIISEDDLN
jgi:DNA-directed RNA polymerase delta subunit